MLNKLFGCSAVAAAALLVGTLPAQAHDGRDDLCGGVMEGDADMVMSGSGKPLLLGTSAPCPEAETVASVETGTADVESSGGDAGDGGAITTRGLDDLPHNGMVYFSLDSTELDAEDQAMLDDIVAAVKAQGDDAGNIVVRGHADRSGGDDYNMSLSEQRAETIAAALIAAGIPEDQVRTMGMGESDPAVATEDGVAMRQNRRAAVQPDG